MMVMRSLWCVAGVVLAFCVPVQGEVIGGNSSADVLDTALNIELLPLVGGGITLEGNLGNVIPSSGTAPAPYNASDSLLNLNLNAGNLAGVVTVVDVMTGTVTTNASSDVDGLFGPRTATATFSVEDLDLSVADLPLFVPDLISITADALTVTSTVTGDLGSALASGVLEVANLRVFVSGVQVGAALNGTIAPNTGIDLSTVLGGVSLVLNQQIATGDGINDVGLITNAIALQITDVGVSGVGTLNGSAIIGPTQASLSFEPAAVPEPSSLVLLSTLGIGAACYRYRKRKQVDEAA